jgi:hypothetical protein
MKSRNWKVLRNGIYLLDSKANSQLGTAPRVAVARFYRFATKQIEDLGFRTPKAIAYTGIDGVHSHYAAYFAQGEEGNGCEDRHRRPSSRQQICKAWARFPSQEIRHRAEKKGR